MKVQFGWILISLIAFVPAASAAERIVIENISVPQGEQNTASLPFGETMMGDGKLLATAGPVFTEGGDYSGTALPYLLSSPQPVKYPRWAVTQGWQGRLVIAVEVLTNGAVGRSKIMESTGHRMLDKAAADAVHTWKFHPAVKDGKLITTCIEISVTFQLDEKE